MEGGLDIRDGIKLILHRYTLARREEGEQSVAYFSNSSKLDFIPDDDDDSRTKLTTFIESLLPFIDFRNVCIDTIVKEIHKFTLDRVVVIQHENCLECFMFE
jgi:hypothetical protein